MSNGAIYSTRFGGFRLVFRSVGDIRANVDVFDFSRKILSFHETGSVNEIYVTNHTNSEVLILGGAFLFGISQHRVFSRPIIIPPARDTDEKYRVPVFCIQRTQSLISAAFSHFGLLPLSFRGGFALVQNQDFIWRVTSRYIECVRRIFEKSFSLSRSESMFIDVNKSLVVPYRLLSSMVKLRLIRKKNIDPWIYDELREFYYGVGELQRRIKRIIDSLTCLNERGESEVGSWVYEWLSALIRLCDWALNMHIQNEQQAMSIYTDLFGILRGHRFFEDVKLDPFSELFVGRVISIVNDVINKYLGANVVRMEHRLFGFDNYSIARVLSRSNINHNTFIRELKEVFLRIREGLGEQIDIDIESPPIDVNVLRAIYSELYRISDLLGSMIERLPRRSLISEPKAIQKALRPLDIETYGISYESIKEANAISLYRGRSLIYEEVFPRPISRALWNEILNSIILDIVVSGDLDLMDVENTYHHKKYNITDKHSLIIGETQRSVKIEIVDHKKPVYRFKVSKTWLGRLIR